jgi:hypothetical protein
MSEICLCDRCGEAFEIEYGFAGNGIRKIVVSPDGYERSAECCSMLCPSCMAALNDWLKGEQK